MLLVVGGHSRNIGKTSVAAGLIRTLRDCRWTALKITQYGHGVCSHAGQACGCETEPEHPVALTEECEPGRSDSGRFLAAGAVRSYWLRTPAGGIAAAEPLIRRMIEANPNLIVESNSVLEIVDPDLYLMVLDFGCEDFKASSLRFFDRADAFVVIERGLNGPLWAGVARGRWDSYWSRRITRPRRSPASSGRGSADRLDCAVRRLRYRAAERRDLPDPGSP